MYSDVMRLACIVLHDSMHIEIGDIRGLERGSGGGRYIYLSGTVYKYTGRLRGHDGLRSWNLQMQGPRQGQTCMPCMRLVITLKSTDISNLDMH